MMAYRHVRPSRCAYGMNTVADNDLDFTFVSLYNDASQYVLAVHDFAVASQTLNSLAGFVVAQGQVGDTFVQGSPVVTDRQSMAGQVWQGEGSLPIPAPNLSVSQGAITTGWLHDFPFVVLTPGFSLTYYDLGADKFTLGFWWQVLTPDELDQLYGIEIDIG